MKEQADGTNWMAVADAHLQNLQSETLNTPQWNSKRISNDEHLDPASF